MQIANADWTQLLSNVLLINWKNSFTWHESGRAYFFQLLYVIQSNLIELLDHQPSAILSFVQPTLDRYLTNQIIDR